MVRFKSEATLIKVKLTAKALKSGVMETVYMYIVVTFKTVRFKALAFINGQMGDIISVISLMPKCTGMESCLGLIVRGLNVFTKVRCLLMLFMAAENLRSQTVIFIQGNFKMVNLVDREPTCGKMKN